jgi:hypothetical protein
MTVTIKKKINRLPVAPIVAVLFAGAAGALVLATPKWLLGKWVAASGLATVLSAANPPLGLKAHILIAAGVAGIAGLVTFLGALTVGRMIARKKSRPFVDAPIEAFSAPIEKAAEGVARFDASDSISPPPTGFSRPPIFAERELGAPFMSETSSDAAPTVADHVVPHYDVPVFEAPAYDVAPVAAPVAAPLVVAEIVDPVRSQFPPTSFDPFLNDGQDDVQSDVHDAEPHMPAVHAPDPHAFGPEDADELILGAELIADIPDPETAFAAVTTPISQQPNWMVAQAEVTSVDLPAGEASPEPVVVAPPVLTEPVVEVAPVLQERVEDLDIAELMSRFETGIRRRQLSNLVSATSLTSGQSATGVAADAALRDALGTLERLAASAR